MHSGSRRNCQLYCWSNLQDVARNLNFILNIFSCRPPNISSFDSDARRQNVWPWVNVWRLSLQLQNSRRSYYISTANRSKIRFPFLWRQFNNSAAQCRHRGRRNYWDEGSHRTASWGSFDVAIDLSPTTDSVFAFRQFMFVTRDLNGQ